MEPELRIIWAATISLFFLTYYIKYEYNWFFDALIRPILVFVSIISTVGFWGSPLLFAQLLVCLIALLLVLARVSKRDMALRKNGRLKVSVLPELLWIQVLFWVQFLMERRDYLVDAIEYAAFGYAIVSLFIGVMVLSTMTKNIRHARFAASPEDIDVALPSLTVAIPARNETHALTQTLRGATASKYRKLEVIVLDDCSHDATAQIIKSFAHAGVRFVQGINPPDDWVGKNFAYQTLYEQSSGKYIVFSSVDVHVKPESLQKIVQKMESDDLHMISVLPTDPDEDIFQSLFRNLHAQRSFTSDRPVSSSFWAIRRDALRELGGFNSTSTSLQPEQYFAERTNHSFFISDANLGITMRKRVNSRIESMTRLLMPDMNYSVLSAILYSTGLSLLFIFPFIIAFRAALFGDVPILTALASGIVVLLYGFMAVYISRSIGSKYWLFSFFIAPIVAIAELVILVISFYKYALGEVVWKGRNVCLPTIDSAENRLDSW